MTDSTTQAFNLLTLQKAGLRVEVTQTGAGGSVYRYVLPPRVNGTPGSVTGFRGAPRGFTSDRLDPNTSSASANDALFYSGDPSYLAAQAVHSIFANWGKTLTEANTNLKITPIGRGEIALTATVDALTRIAAQYERVLVIRDALAVRHAQLYAVPAADPATAIVDVEVRAQFRTLPTGDQIGAFTQTDSPDFQRILLAMLRSPFALDPALAKFRNDAWAAQVRQAKPAEAAELGIEEEANSWAIDSTKFIAALLANPSTSGAAMDRFMSYQAVRSVPSLLDFRPEEIIAFERRIANIAA